MLMQCCAIKFSTLPLPPDVASHSSGIIQEEIGSVGTRCHMMRSRKFHLLRCCTGGLSRRLNINDSLQHMSLLCRANITPVPYIVGP